jgi:Transcriptional regulators
MSLITFDNISDPFYFTTTTYVKQNEKEIGKKAVDTVIDCITNGISTPHIYLSCNMVENTSVKDLNAK